MEAESDTASLVAVRVSVAKMEGMLTQALSDHGTRISSLEAGQVAIHARLAEKGKLLATHTEQITSNRERIEDLEDHDKSDQVATHTEQLQAHTYRIKGLEDAKDATTARLIAVAGVVVAAASFVFQFLPFGPA